MLYDWTLSPELPRTRSFPPSDSFLRPGSFPRDLPRADSLARKSRTTRMRSLLLLRSFGVPCQRSLERERPSNPTRGEDGLSVSSSSSLSSSNRQLEADPFTFPLLRSSSSRFRRRSSRLRRVEDLSERPRLWILLGRLHHDVPIG